MPSYGAECFDSGLFTMLSVVLNSSVPGYFQFCNRSVESWQTLGLEEDAIEAIVFRKSNLKAEGMRDALRSEIPVLIGKSYGNMGRCYYELGFWCGTLFLAVMSDLAEVTRDSIHNLKYKCAEAKNPQPMVEFVKSSEMILAKGQKIDIVKLASFTEEFHLWIMANITIDCRKSLEETILEISLTELPYIGKVLKAIYEHVHSRDASGNKKPWWKLW
jgi:hypothetical protein